MPSPYLISALDQLPDLSSVTWKVRSQDETETTSYGTKAAVLSISSALLDAEYMLSSDLVEAIQASDDYASLSAALKELD